MDDEENIRLPISIYFCFVLMRTIIVFNVTRNHLVIL